MTTTAQARSPLRRSGRPITATSATLGCGEEQVLDLLGADVLALADDDVLEPAGDRDVAVGVERARGRRCGSSRRRRTRRRRATRRGSPACSCGPWPRISPSSPGAGRRSPSSVTTRELDAGHRAGPRCRRASRRRRRRGHREDRALGEPVARDDARRRRAPPSARSAAAAASARRRRGTRRTLGKSGSLGLRALRGEVGHGGTTVPAPASVTPLAAQHRDRRSPGRRPRRARRAARTSSAANSQSMPADVGEREHQGDAVVRRRARARAHAVGRPPAIGRVGVPRALRVGGRARRVEDPADRVAVGRRRRGGGRQRRPGRRRAARGRTTSTSSRRRPPATCVGHRLVVEAPPHATARRAARRRSGGR